MPVFRTSAEYDVVDGSVAQEIESELRQILRRKATSTKSLETRRTSE